MADALFGAGTGQSGTALVPYQALKFAGTFAAVIPKTDAANAHLFATRNQDRARYCHRLKKWLIWDGYRWTIDVDGEIRRLALSTVKEMATEAIAREDGANLKWAKDSHNSPLTKSGFVDSV